MDRPGASQLLNNMTTGEKPAWNAEKEDDAQFARERGEMALAAKILKKKKRIPRAVTIIEVNEMSDMVLK